MIALKTENLTVSYSGVEAINDISVEIKKGDFVSIIGPNGGGKTTFLSAVLNIIKKDSGKVIFYDKKPNISYVPQRTTAHQNFPINCLETVLSAFLDKKLNLLKNFSKSEKATSLEALSLVGLKGFEKRQVSALSGGEFQRLLIARAIVSNPEIIFLDEPTANVDIESRDKIFSVLKELNKNGKTIVIVTHDLSAAKEYSNKVISINRTVIFDGLPDEKENLSTVFYCEHCLKREQSK